jgi:hypothetical protein
MEPVIQRFQGDLIVRTQMEEGAEWVVWFQKLINSTPKMNCKAYKVEGADHLDL